MIHQRELQIIRAGDVHDLNVVRILFREYQRHLDVDLGFQNFEEELASLPGEYRPPDGILLLANVGDDAVGCVALRRFDEYSCEMKRLYVRPGFRGFKIGRYLAEAIIEEAIRIGYTRMRLDTLETLAEAMHLYESLGFRRVSPYYQNPLPGVVFWELELSDYVKRS